MAITQIDKERLKKFREKVASLQLRFPIATLAEKMEMDRGNFSSYYNGKKRLTEKFLERFYKAVAGMGSEYEYSEINSIAPAFVQESDHIYQPSQVINELEQKIEYLAKKQAKALENLDKLSSTLDHLNQLVDRISKKVIDFQTIKTSPRKSKQTKEQPAKKKKPIKR